MTLRFKMKRFALLTIFFLLLPAMASAWWHDNWGYKKKIILELPKLQQNAVTVPTSNAFALVRLHTGNFSFFLDLAAQGKDIRLLAADEKTPLKFYIEKIDTVNEMALIWVQLPKDSATTPEPAIWLYYGNPNAVNAQEAAGAFDNATALVYGLNKKIIKDLSANANDPIEATSTVIEGGLIAEAAEFMGNQIIRVPAKPSLAMSPVTGWTFSTWLKIDKLQQNTVLWQRNGFRLSLREQTPYLEITNPIKEEFASTLPVNAGAWHHLAVVATANELTIYVDGVAARTCPVMLPELTDDITIGADVNGSRGFVGTLDQLSLVKSARRANDIKFDVLMQGANSPLLTYGEDSTPEQEEGSESYLMSTLDNVTVDGWVIIGILGVMFAISLMVIVSKIIIVNRAQRDNKKFEHAFSKLSVTEMTKLNHASTEEDEDYEQSPLLLSLTSGRHQSDFAGSNIYRIYHVGVEEMNRRLGKNSATLSSAAMTAVKASMDAVLMRELQKLNAQMVLLTIAISGGPFLGLLGTVVGVMITFAAIAASGEVNVNAIAPGIAAALVATVAGLSVAIPALFAYNYIGSRIKVVTTDMHVFVDEFIAKLAEQHT